MAASRQAQLTSLLDRFYKQPVAKVSLELVLTLGMVLFMAVFAIQPTLVTMSDLLKEIEEKKTVDEQLGRKVAALASAQTEYLSIESELDYLEEALPTEPDVVTDLKIIEKLASENSIIITALNVSRFPDTSSESEKLTVSDYKRQSLPVVVTVQADYRSIRSFVESLKKNRRSFQVESVVFNLQKNRSQETLSASITLDLPYFGIETNDKRK